MKRENDGKKNKVMTTAVVMLLHLLGVGSFKTCKTTFRDINAICLSHGFC